MREVLARPWVKLWAPGLFVFQKSSLSSLRGAHLCEFGENFGGGAAIARAKVRKSDFAMAAPPPKFAPNSHKCRRGVTLYCKPFYYIKRL